MEVRPWSRKKGPGVGLRKSSVEGHAQSFGSKSDPTPRPRTLLCSRDLEFGVYGGTIPTRMSIPWILVPVAAVTTTAKNIKPAPAPLRGNLRRRINPPIGKPAVISTSPGTPLGWKPPEHVTFNVKVNIVDIPSKETLQSGKAGLWYTEADHDKTRKQMSKKLHRSSFFE